MIGTKVSLWTSWTLLMMFTVTVVTQFELVQKFYVKGCQCNASEKYVFKNFSCFPKSFNRTFSTMNVIATAKQPVRELMIEVRLFYKYGTIYRQVIHVAPTDYCKMVKESTTNKLVSQLKLLMKDTMGPTAMHDCPYSELNIRNASIQSFSLIPIFATGDYKFIVYLTNKNSESLLVVNVIASIVTPNKDTFGRK